MANPKGMKGMNIALETHEKLTQLKKEDESYDDVVRKLIELELKYNPHDTTIEYEYSTVNMRKLFRVIFQNKNYTIEYYNPQTHEFMDHISAWETSPAINNLDKDMFIKFIIDRKNVLRLRGLEMEETFKHFKIRKVG